MKKSITALTLAILMVLVFGCQESQIAGSEKIDHSKNIEKVLVQWHKAFEKQDIDGIMAVYSENYIGQQGEGKAQVRNFIQELIANGTLANSKMDIEKVEIEIDGDIATVAPITYSGDWGQMSIKNTLKKEGPTWRVTSSAEYY